MISQVLAVAALLSILSMASATAREVIGRGDILFYMDSAAFLGQRGKVLQEVYLRIPNSELKFRESGGAFQSEVDFKVLISDLEGNPVIEDAQRMHFNETDQTHIETAAYFQTIIKRYHLDPGAYSLSVSIVDQYAEKLSIAGMVKDSRKRSVIRNVRLVPPEFSPGQAAFSDARFSWSEIAPDGYTEYQPNPSRLYGLYRDSLFVYLELYLPDDMAGSPTFEFSSQVTDDSSNVLVSRKFELPNPGKGTLSNGLRAYPIMIREDLSAFLAGSYGVYISFGLDGKLLSRSHCGEFSVAWDMRTWEVPRREYLAEARFLLGDSEFEKFKHIDPGLQEERLNLEWKTHDPTPETAENEAYLEFLVRLAFAVQHYSEGNVSAVFTPRGQLYLRYGPPDEMVIDVIPINRQTYQEAVASVEDPFHTINMSSHSENKPYSIPRINAIADPRRLGGQREGDHVAYPFELWIYDAAGDPILERDRTKEINVGMRFIFVDRDGYGRYRLESSSSITTK